MDARNWEGGGAMGLLPGVLLILNPSLVLSNDTTKSKVNILFIYLFNTHTYM